MKTIKINRYELEELIKEVLNSHVNSILFAGNSIQECDFNNVAEKIVDEIIYTKTNINDNDLELKIEDY